MPLNYWLLSAEALQLRAARDFRGPLLARSGRGSGGERPSPLTVEDGVATIRVEGVLTPEPDAQSAWYGEANTTYPELSAALGAALADKKVREIVWSINSPGGSVDGLFDLLDDIAEARAAKKTKPMRAVATNAHSAAYGIAAAVGRIAAVGRMASFGSVGVTTNAFVLGEMIGKVVHMTNTDAPEKRPEFGTPEGRQVVVRYLDQIGGEFMTAIAKGRGVTVGDVASGYGRGSSMLATAALSARMIDEILTRPSSHVRTNLTDVRGADTVPVVNASSQTEPAADPTEPAADPTEPEAPAPESETLAAEPTEPEAPAPAQAVAAALPAAAPLSAAERAELAELRAERAARLDAERTSLVSDLITLRAETPATAYVGGKLVARLAGEPLADMRTRVAALRTSAPQAQLTPAASGAGLGEESLTEYERADAAKIKDPVARERFVKSRLARKQK